MRSAESEKRSGLRGWVPRWWRGEGGMPGAVLDTLLWPAEGGYRAATRMRGLAYEMVFPVHRAEVPVISVGNIAVGGAGKTPFTAWLAQRLSARGRKPAVVLRGYGADEILVHRELNPTIPVFVAVKRRKAARDAAAAGCDAVLLDDGFQHRALHRDLDIVLVAAESWSRNPRLLPRGPWREAPGALARAGVLVVTRKTATASDAATVMSALTPYAPEALQVSAHLAADRLIGLHDSSDRRPLQALARLDVLAVASLADPRPFERHLIEAGAAVELRTFPDHHDFTVAEAQMLEQRAAGRTIVFTRKEAVKLRPLLDPATPALVLEQRVEIESGRSDLIHTVWEALHR